MQAGGPIIEGRLPSRLYEHFFRSLADNAGLTLHLRVLRGRDRHHVVEAAVKATGFALRQALAEGDTVFSTKGGVRVNAERRGLMLLKRIIVCLDVKDGRVVKGVSFGGLRDVGDPVELAVRYEAEGADEIIFLDISASVEGRRTLLDVVHRTAERIFIPLTVGGGVQDIDDIAAVLRAGADKISINTAAVTRPELIGEASARYGNQCVVASIDARRRAAPDRDHVERRNGFRRWHSDSPTRPGSACSRTAAEHPPSWMPLAGRAAASSWVRAKSW